MPYLTLPPSHSPFCLDFERRGMFTPILLLLAILVSGLIPHTAMAQVIFPAPGVYHCAENQFSECRPYSTKTPAIENCSEWGAWLIANALDSRGGPYTVRENLGESYGSL